MAKDGNKRNKKIEPITDEEIKDLTEASENADGEESDEVELSLSVDELFGSEAETEEEFKVDDVGDGLIYSLTTRGKVDVNYIASICGLTVPEVTSRLKGAIYQNPETWDERADGGWETADEYLSGNLMRKWRSAKFAAKQYGGNFLDNVKAIEKVFPAAVDFGDIYVTLGSPWVPADVIDDFIEHLFGESRYSKYGYGGVRHDAYIGTWEIPCKMRYGFSTRMVVTYGTRRMDALEIMERTLNLKSITVTDEIACNTTKSGIKRVINRSETAAALDRQRKMIEEFQKWIFADDVRKRRLLDIYEEKFGCYRKRHFDGSFLRFPGMNPNIELYPYQKDAIARIIFSPNTLLAHDVGAGKTYVMIAAAMELKRTGQSKRNLFVVPNGIVAQWAELFVALYPAAKLLVVEPKNFTPDKRDDVLAKIKKGGYDGVIMAHSCFDSIKLSDNYYKKVYRERKAHITDLIRNNGYAYSTAGLYRARKKAAKMLAAVGSTPSSSELKFDELKIDRLFVDEAHLYKNVPIESSLDRVLGLSLSGSAKCRNMLDKVRSVQRTHNGGGVVMATGTPITNSIADAYVFQSYLQSGELALLDLNSFDAWIGMFADRATDFEIDVDTNQYRMATRFSQFHNLPELTSLLSSIADFHRAENESGLPVCDGYIDVLVDKTAAFDDYLKKISERADAVRHGKVDRKTDNMLKITGDGRRAALDIRVVDPAMPFTTNSKAYRCAREIVDIYRATADRKSTQIVFCDTSTPKDGFNMYDELKRLLVNEGVAEGEIAYVHDGDTAKRREALFGKVRAGKVRVLIGSTFKLGVGVNVQDRLIALHHLDVPWRPADMVQREGRILRPGNENQKVYLFRYVTKGSFDAYSWQLLETKQKFISALLSGSWSERKQDDVDGTALSYGEIKALAVGNPLLKKRVEVANELSRKIALQSKLAENRDVLNRRLSVLPAEAEALKKRLVRIRADAEYVKKGTVAPDKEERKVFREYLYELIPEHVMRSSEREVGSYRGFKVILPGSMQILHPTVKLVRADTYYVELGASAVGGLARIDNCIDGLENLYKKGVSKLKELETQEKQIKEELARDESYADEIERLKALLAEIDSRLNKSEG